MTTKRLLGSPLLVLVAGLGATAVGLALLLSGTELSPIEIARPALVGTFATGVTAIVAGLQRQVVLAESRELIQAEHDAKHDPLTGLANRTELYRELELSLERSKLENTVFGVLFLDLDRFKVVNDSMGHDAGDELLKIVAERLRAATRATDVVARLGGGEFVLICRGLMSSDSVLAVVRQILKRFSEPVQLNGRQQVVTTSVGVAIATTDELRTPEELVRDADAAMYKAKRDRSGFAVFDDAQRTQLSARLAIERDLGRAFDEEQLMVYYQPIFDVKRSTLYGFEALVRWNHPGRGLVQPDEFLPVAEDARLLSKLGELVLREACAQAAVWNHLHPGAEALRISVNVAEQQLVDSSFPSLVNEVIGWSGLRPEQLVLEITEDVVVEHLDSLTMLRRIRELGVSLAIDDFGTGQSSLSYIKEFDMATTLKIDKSFVSQMHSGSADQAIVEAIVTMASALDLAIVAEGVEGEDDVDRLTRLGVHLMQGYYFGRPTPAEAVGDLTSVLEKAKGLAEGGERRRKDRRRRDDDLGRRRGGVDRPNPAPTKR
ncbi:MAG: putative bifunctional diguanylate cyclase/phosphodiesterase [Acidimicrobiales bacterium]